MRRQRLPLVLVLVLALCSLAGGCGPQPESSKNPVTADQESPRASVKPANVDRQNADSSVSVEDDRDAPAREILAAIRDYRDWSRVSDRAGWIPVSRVEMVGTGGVRPSRLTEDIAHGRHLFFIYAKDPAAYLAPMSIRFSERTLHGSPVASESNESLRLAQVLIDSSSAPRRAAQPSIDSAATTAYVSPIGQIVVKETFFPIETAPPDGAGDSRGGRHGDGGGQPEDESATTHLESVRHRRLVPPADHAELDGTWYKAGEGAGLFVMMKTGPADAPNTDNGWTYAVVDSTATRVIDHGPIQSCISCHASAPHDRLFVPVTARR